MIIDTSREEFYIIDSIVTGHAFDIQNEFGRFCSEKIYQNELALRCLNDNALNTVSKEVSINISCDDFTKEYQADLVINESFIYELKACRALSSEHEAQLLNYLIITNNHYGKLINFGSTSVEYRFISTTLTAETKHECIIDDDEWRGASPASELFKSCFCQLLNEWGLFLEVSLYVEAVVTLLGADKHTDCFIPFLSEYGAIGGQKFHLLDGNAAFKISAVNKAQQTYENNIIKLLAHTDLKCVHWVNMAGHHVTFKTIINPNKKY